MSLGFFRSKAKKVEIFSPVTGTTFDLSKVKDPVFSEGILGKGIAILPEEENVYAPCDGKITMVADTNHAIGLTSETGVEILIHVGIDTVSLNGAGFKMLVSDGKTVKKGDLLMQFDVATIVGKDLATDIMVIITNSSEYAEIQANVDKHVTAGQHEILNLQK